MLIEQLKEIIAKEGDVLPFILKLTDKEKIEIRPALKKLRKKVNEYRVIEKKGLLGTSTQYSPAYTPAQKAIVDKVCYFCYTKTDAVRDDLAHRIITDDFMENILPIYIPKWYGELINEALPRGLGYVKLMDLFKEGVLEPSHALIINNLPFAIIESKREPGNYQSFYRPERLEKHPETLDIHIWYLFEEESNINNYYDFLNLENYSNGNDIWIETFLNLVHTKKLDRKKTLIATIYTATKGFNQNLSGWFYNLLIKLEPTQDEILLLQNEFIAALNSPHSKIVNTVLKYFKQVATAPNFNPDSFVESSSALLNSETKSVVNSTLMILEKLAKKNKSLQSSICIAASEALINLDEKIQLRAAKLINKYGSTEDEDLVSEINLHTSTLLHSSKKILAAYVTEEKHEEEPIEHEKTILLSPDRKIPIYESLDDMIFFVSQAIDNNEVYHIDLLMNYLPKLNKLINADNVSNLEPIFKRSLDLTLSFDWASHIGQLESSAAHYLNDYAKLLIIKYPAELKNLLASKTKKINRISIEGYYSKQLMERLKDIEHQSVPDYIYRIHQTLFVKSKSLLKKGRTLDLLSTPTHAPCWIDPEVLIDRINAYEQVDELINLYDFQIAIGRLPMQDQSTVELEKIYTIKDKDIRQSLLYHFGFEELQNIDLSHPEMILQSVLSRNIQSELTFFQEQLANPLQKEMGTYEWYCEQKERFYNDYDYATKTQKQVKIIDRSLKFRNFCEKPEDKSKKLISNIKGIFSKTKKQEEVDSFYNSMYFNNQGYSTLICPHDEVKFLFLSPNNPSMFLSHFVHYRMESSTFFEETSKKNMINLLKGLYEIWYRKDYTESTYLFLATGLLCSDKVARELAAEIWIKTSSEGTMNSVLLGQIIGKLEFEEYAPLKRWTDLLTSSIFNISKTHNRALLELLNPMIGAMNTVPIRGVKKLVELYLELKLSHLDIAIGASTEEVLNQWKNVKSLNSIIKKLLK